MDWKLELVGLPVSDIDRAKAFYVDQVGFVADHDHTVSDEIRFVQVTPPGSACSVAFGRGISNAEPGSLDALADGGRRRRAGPHRAGRRAVWRSPTSRSCPWGSFVYFRDPDGNAWSVQQLPPRCVRAVVYDRYGSPDVLRVDNVAVPVPTDGQVRVKVAATSINLSDWECLRGSPLYARLGGLRSPARRTLGSDIAGWVDAVGAGVTRFRPGDEVYGDNLALKGGFAEYTLAPESALVHKPAALTFTEASTIPQAGAIALQGTDGAAVDQSSADQRRRRRLRLLRDSARETTRFARDRRRQRRQARLHAVPRCGRGHRLSQCGLHP